MPPTPPPAAILSQVRPLAATVSPPLRRVFSVAPMMDRTDRHYRYLARLLSRHTLLYTEMIPVGAIVHGDRDRFLAFDPSEHPVAIQLGGSDPAALARAASLAAERGFDEVNLNVGCPSDRVRSGHFGACLMAEPELVANCVRAMRGAVDVPVTVKTRIGIDDLDTYEYFEAFVETVLAAGADAVIVHARKAWLSGLSPRENREIPPLRHDVVHRFKRSHAAAEIIINGGIDTLTQAREQLDQVDGVMMGREAFRSPYVLAGVDRTLFGDTAGTPTREDVVERYAPYVAARLDEGVPLHRMVRPLLGLYLGQPNARLWRRMLTVGAPKRSDAGFIPECLHEMRMEASVFTAAADA